MLLSLSFLVAMETKIIFSNIYNDLNINILRNIVREHCSKSNLLQLSKTRFCLRFPTHFNAKPRDNSSESWDIWDKTWDYETYLRHRPKGIKITFLIPVSFYQIPFVSLFLKPTVSYRVFSLSFQFTLSHHSSSFTVFTRSYNISHSKCLITHHIHYVSYSLFLKFVMPHIHYFY